MVFGFSTENALKCSFSCESSENLLPHKVQLNGFSSECPLKCSFSCESSENLLPHKVQLNGFSTELLNHALGENCLSCLKLLNQGLGGLVISLSVTCSSSHGLMFVKGDTIISP